MLNDRKLNMKASNACNKCSNEGTYREVMVTVEGGDVFEDVYCDCEIGKQLRKKEVCDYCDEMKTDCICNTLYEQRINDDIH